MEGDVTAIDKGSKTVTIRAENGAEATFKVISATELDGVSAIDELTVGTEVEAQFNPTTNELIKLEVED